MLIMTEREVIFLRSWFSKCSSDQYLAIFFLSPFNQSLYDSSPHIAKKKKIQQGFIYVGSIRRLKIVDSSNNNTQLKIETSAAAPCTQIGFCDWIHIGVTIVSLRGSFQ